MSDIIEYIIYGIIGLGLLSVVVSVGIMLSVLTGPTETELGKCYERYGNVIQDVTCEVPVLKEKGQIEVKRGFLGLIIMFEGITLLVFKKMV